MQPGLNRRLFLQGLALSCTLAPWLAGAGEGEYRSVRWWGHLDGQGEKVFRVIREFSLKGQKLLWLVDEETLHSSIHDRSQVRRLEEISGSDSRYTRCIQLASSPPYPLENSGIRRANHEVNGIFLTIDLCPSPQGMEYRLFEALLKSDLPRPIPLSLAISGGWLRHHRADAKWLLERERDGDFDLLWINHSYNHFYDRGVASQHNFFLRPDTLVEAEILRLEWMLIQAGMTPSIFFRFPGLVANEQLVKTVASLGLVTVGCDSWLAKNRRFSSGSILLVHGNGNEPWGVDIFLNLLKKSPGQLKLKPLYQVTA